MSKGCKILYISLPKGVQTEGLNIAHTHLEEHQEITDELRSISEKEAQVASAQNTEKSNTESQEKVCQFSSCPRPLTLSSSFEGK